jgi:hypothetical protein
MEWWTETFEEQRLATSERALDEACRAFVASGLAVAPPLACRLSSLLFDDEAGTLKSAGVTLAKRDAKPWFRTAYPVAFYDRSLTRAVHTRYPYDPSFGNPLHNMGPAICRARVLARTVNPAFACRDLRPRGRVHVDRRAFVLRSGQVPSLDVELFFDRVVSREGGRGSPAVDAFQLVARYSPDADPAAIGQVREFLGAAATQAPERAGPSGERP